MGRSRTKRGLPTLTVALTLFTAIPILIVTLSSSLSFPFSIPRHSHPFSRVPINANQILNKCSHLNTTPSPAPSFYSRTQSDRYVPGTKPLLIRNATIWTGRMDGLEVVRGDVLMDGGIIKKMGRVDTTVIKEVLGERPNYDAVNVEGAWVTPGIIDVHSHVGVEPSPALAGANDGNSFKGPIVPWLRALDGLNTHDEGYRLAMAGGVTTSLILPGSANAIGGQGFAIKLRPTEERSASAMLLEPAFEYNGTGVYEYDAEYPRWRHMKHACGENPSRVYDATRLDSVWAWREAYDTARQLMHQQDEFCTAAQAGEWHKIEGKKFPEDLQWEAMVDILRGKVKVQTHCYEAVDLDNFVRLSNEFKFPIAAFHHAHEAYLVPDVLKRAYGPTPAVAIFSVFSRYKREASRASVFAAKVLNEAGIRVTMKSDHPAIQSRYLLHEAQQAHHYGLPYWTALSAVTSTAAGVIGLDHRIGYIHEGYDADLVIWDSHPLSLGATPIQTIIDGIPQLAKPHALSKPKPSHLQHPPHTPDYEAEAELAVQYEGLPPVLGYFGEEKQVEGTVVFRNVSKVYRRDRNGVRDVTEDLLANSGHGSRDVLVRHGRIVTSASTSDLSAAMAGGALIMDLEGGSLSPALVAAATSIGLQEIAMEKSTADGVTYDPLVDGDGNWHAVLGNLSQTMIRAVDGLQFASRDALLSYRNGVSTAFTSPESSGFLSGLGVAFSLGTPHKLAKGSIVQEVTALHVRVVHNNAARGPSVSTEIAALRKVLMKGEGWFGKVAKGDIPLVVNAQSADIIATLIALKSDVESTTGATMKMTILGGTEAHLVADELRKASIGVVVSPVRSYPYSWEDKRIMPGRPLSHMNLVEYLLERGVEVAIAPQAIDDFTPAMGAWAVQNLRFDAGWLVSDGLPTSLALSLASSKVDDLLGVKYDPEETDLVVTKG